MKITELMIGNKIYRPCCVDRVVEIREDGIIGVDVLRGLIAFEELAPIPITKEFLNANGFTRKCIIEPDEYYPKGLYEWHKRIDDYLIEVRIEETSVWSIYIYNDDNDNIAGIDVQYVHQLQNFMNILGIEMEVNV